jgi:hypothetical protein
VALGVDCAALIVQEGLGRDPFAGDVSYSVGVPALCLGLCLLQAIDRRNRVLPVVGDGWR